MRDIPVDKRSVRTAFDRAASTYDTAAVVQREICNRLDAFGTGRVAPSSVQRYLDAGCGTGYGLQILARRFPWATPFALDFALAMLSRLDPASAAASAASAAICADLEALPLADSAFDMVWSSLALQWCDPAVSLAEIARVLRPGGIALIATLGPATLHELRDAFASVDDARHVITFHAPEHWVLAARDAGLDCHALEHAPVHATAPDLRQLLRDIKAIGAHSVGAARRRAPLGRAAWRTLEARYEAHRRPDGLLPATYDLILLALERPEMPDA